MLSMSSEHAVCVFLSLAVWVVVFTPTPPSFSPPSYPSSNQHLCPFSFLTLVPFHLFLITLFLWQGAACTLSEPKTCTCMETSPLLCCYHVTLSFYSRGNKMFFLISWSSKPATARIHPGCLSPWQQESERSQPELRGRWMKTEGKEHINMHVSPLTDRKLSGIISKHLTEAGS